MAELQFLKTLKTALFCTLYKLHTKQAHQVKNQDKWLQFYKS